MTGDWGLGICQRRCRALLFPRQHAIALRLADVERALYTGDASTPTSGDRPPLWALLHDPGAQAAYVAAHDHAIAWPIATLDELAAHLP